MFFFSQKPLLSDPSEYSIDLRPGSPFMSTLCRINEMCQDCVDHGTLMVHSMTIPMSVLRLLGRAMI